MTNVAEAYNPIIRTFCRLRSVLVDELGLARERVCPAAPLDDLIPAERLGEVLARLRQAGFAVPPHELRLLEAPLCEVLPLAPLVLLVPVLLQSWVALLAVLPVVLGLGLLAFGVTRERVVQVPLGPRTVGELVIYLTRFREHQAYPFTRNEIALKVRLIVAEWLGVPVDQVREDSAFVNMGTYGRAPS